MEKIQIECASCGQKFAVSESYMNKVVECGACDHQFKVDESTIVKDTKRFYPGEKSNINKDSFTRVESDTIANQATANNELGFQPAPTKHKKVAAGYAQPPSAKRAFALIAGAILLIIFILVFVLGSREGGILQDVDSQKRIILASFIAIVGSLLIIIGARQKLKAILFSLIFGGSLAAMPFIFPVITTPENITDTKVGIDLPGTQDDPLTTTEIDEKIEEYKNNIGYRKVISRRASPNNPDRVKAIVVRDIGSHTDTICDYFIEELGLEDQPTTYGSERSLEGRRVTLLILEAEISTPDLLELTKKFGSPAEMDEMRTELDIIEVTVQESKLKNPSLDTLTDQSRIEFFHANYDELHNISKSRRLAAIQRLEKVNVSLGRRSDISDRLAEMIDLKHPRISTEAIRALKKWTSPEYNHNDKVKNYAASLADKGNLEIPVMEYIIEKKVPGISDILKKQWLNSNGHLIWDNLIQSAGAEGEAAIIAALPQADSAHLKSAASALQTMGTRKSLPALNAAMARAGKEDAKYLKATIDEIQSRR